MIIVCGKPRAGTTSVAAALEILGVKTLHWCPLTSGPNILGDLINKQQRNDELIDYDCLVSWRLTPYLHQASYCFDIEGVIFLDRENGWESSCLNMGLSSGQISRISTDFNSAVEQVKAPNKVIKLESLGWHPICSFLGLEIPRKQFPHKNKLESVYQI